MTTQKITRLAASRPRARLLVSAFVGINQLAFVGFGDCVASVALQRVFGVERECVR